MASRSKGMKYPSRAAPSPPTANGKPKKKPPPRPPPPNFNRYVRPSHFERKPTVLSSLKARKPRLAGDSVLSQLSSQIASQSPTSGPGFAEADTGDSLIDFSSAPSSPSLTIRSSSDGLSIDSFGSDATGSNRVPSGAGNGNASQAESGFEDDFDLLSGLSDPFSPPRLPKCAPLPVRDSDFLDPLCNGKSIISDVRTGSGPTIIRAKPAITRPRERRDFEESNLEEDVPSPPMPSGPPPPPPFSEFVEEDQEPYAIALYDYPGTHDDDLPFKTGNKIKLCRRLNEEWLFGKLRNGMEGMFPANFVEIKIPLEENTSVASVQSSYATALYDFVPERMGDLGFTVGSKINVVSRLNDDWLIGEIDGNRGQFPSNRVDTVPLNLPDGFL